MAGNTTSSTKNWSTLVKQAEPNRNQKIIVYTFSNGKTFTEKQNKGYS